MDLVEYIEDITQLSECDWVTITPADAENFVHQYELKLIEFLATQKNIDHPGVLNALVTPFVSTNKFTYVNIYPDVVQELNPHGNGCGYFVKDKAGVIYSTHYL